MICTVVPPNAQKLPFWGHYVNSLQATAAGAPRRSGRALSLVARLPGAAGRV